MESGKWKGKKRVPELRFPEFEGEWEERKLGEVAEIIMGQSPKSENYNDDRIGIPLIQGNADIKNRRTSPTIYTTQITKMCNIGDLILSVRAPVGHIAISKHNACIGRGVCAIKTIQSKYIYNYLLRNERKWKRYEQGSTFTSINSEVINDYSIWIPSLSEQQKIGNFFYKIDKKLELQQQRIEALKEYKKGMMQKIFSQEIRFKDDNGKDYPEWEEKRLGEVAEIKYGYTPSTKVPENFGGEYVWYGVTDLISKKIYKSKRTLSKKGYKENRLINKGTLLMSFKLTIGSLSITEVDCFTNEAIANFTWKEAISTNFMYYRLKTTNIMKYGNQAVQGITLNSDSLNSIIVLLPSYEEQTKIANFLSSLDKKIELEEEKLENFKQFKKGLMQKMFI